MENSWVESYLDALLSFGLSSEHLLPSKGHERFDAEDPERQVYSRFYVSQILALDEDAIRTAWGKATKRPGSTGGGERDARLEQLAWRCWTLKRTRADRARQRAAGVSTVPSSLGLGLAGEDSASQLQVYLEPSEDVLLSAVPSRAPTPPGSPGPGPPHARRPTGHDTAHTPPLLSIQEPDLHDRFALPATLGLAGRPPRSPVPSGSQIAVGAPPSGLQSPTAARAGGLAPIRTVGLGLGLSGEGGLGDRPAAAEGSRDLREGSGHGHGLAIGVTSGPAPRPSPPPSAANASGSGLGSPVPTGALAGLGPAPLPPPSPHHLDALLPEDFWEGRFNKLYIVMISLHGLVRGNDLELGKDPDTGGQVKYVVELARALAQHPGVARVDLLTRLIRDPKVDASYSVPEERLELPRAEGGRDPGEAYIVRLPCGPEEQYLRKELLWPHVREFADRTLAHIRRTLYGSGGAKPLELYLVHGHYADAAEIAALVSHTLQVPMVLTGHSLGRNKLEQVTKIMSRRQAEDSYRLSRRIEAEERGLDAAVFGVTSTQEEIDKQWGLYDGFSAQLEATLRTRRFAGRAVPFLMPIPPGLDFAAQQAHSTPIPRLASGPHPDVHSESGSPPTEGPGSPLPGLMGGDNTEPRMWREIARFLRNPRKPCLLAIARPDTKKNLIGLIKGYAENRPLREIANLVLIMGSRTSIDAVAPASKQVLEQVLKLVDSLDLYGSVAYPKQHRPTEVPDIYRYCLATRGVFINCALQEPFGLTIIEAAAHGLPVVATKNGGPVDILATLGHGFLCDPASPADIADKCLRLVTDRPLWEECSRHGRERIGFYSWSSHCRRFLSVVENLRRLNARRERHRVAGRTQGGHRRALSGDAWSHRLERVSLADVAEVPEEPQDTQGPGSPNPAPSASLQGSAPVPSAWGGAIHLPQAALSALLKRSLSLDLTGDPDLDSLQSAVGPVFRKMIFVALDGPASAPAACRALRALLAAKKSRRALPTGIAVLSHMDLAETKRTLGRNGVSLADIAVLVCNAGAELWTVRPAPGGPADAPLGPDPSQGSCLGSIDEAPWSARQWDRAASAKEVELVSDAEYDALAGHQWDRAVTARVVQQWSAHYRPPGPGSGAASQASEAQTSPAAPGSGAEGVPPLAELRPLPDGQKAPLHPFHLPFGVYGTALGGRGSDGALHAHSPQQVIASIRRRLRLNGVRATLCLQMGGEAPDRCYAGLLRPDATPESPGPVGMLHVTPLRASRALAVRYVAHAQGLNVEDCGIVLCYEPGPTGGGNDAHAHAQAGPAPLGLYSHVSDAEDLCGGALSVLLVPSTDTGAGAGGAQGPRKAEGRTEGGEGGGRAFALPPAEELGRRGTVLDRLESGPVRMWCKELISGGAA